MLFGVGVIVAAFDLAVEYQNGRANIKSTMLNVLKGFFAANLVTVVPVHLYTFLHLAPKRLFERPCRRLCWLSEFQPGGSSSQGAGGKFGPPTVGPSLGLLNLLTLVALATVC